LVIELLNEKKIYLIFLLVIMQKKTVIGSSENYIPTELEEKYKGFEN